VVLSAVPDGTGPCGMYTQDCVLGYFQPSLTGLDLVLSLRAGVFSAVTGLAPVGM
jgi:hypothetical protein